MNALLEPHVVLQETRSFGKLRAVIRQRWPGIVWIHCDISNWSLSAAKECLQIWPKFQEELVALGHKRVFSCIPGNDAKLAKWQRMFGMKEVTRVEDKIIFKKDLDHGN